MRSHPHLTTAALCVPAVLGTIAWGVWERFDLMPWDALRVLFS